VKFLATYAQRVVSGLAWTGAVSIKRERKTIHSYLAHAVLLVVRRGDAEESIERSLVTAA
jgi:hypothetical protein